MLCSPFRSFLFSIHLCIKFFIFPYPLTLQHFAFLRYTFFHILIYMIPLYCAPYSVSCSLLIVASKSGTSISPSEW